jgi:hypothetical protein
MTSNNGSGKRLSTQSSVNSSVKSIYDIKAVNPNRKVIVDERAPVEILVDRAILKSRFSSSSDHSLGGG